MLSEFQVEREREGARESYRERARELQRVGEREGNDDEFRELLHKNSEDFRVCETRSSIEMKGRGVEGAIQNRGLKKLRTFCFSSMEVNRGG